MKTILSKKDIQFFDTYSFMTHELFTTFVTKIELKTFKKICYHSSFIFILFSTLSENWVVNNLKSNLNSTHHCDRLLQHMWREAPKNMTYFIFLSRSLTHSWDLFSNSFSPNVVYRISSYSFRGNYSFLDSDLEIQRSQYIRPKVTVHICAETIQGRKLFKGGNYMRKYGTSLCPLNSALSCHT